MRFILAAAGLLSALTLVACGADVATPEDTAHHDGSPTDDLPPVEDTPPAEPDAGADVIVPADLDDDAFTPREVSPPAPRTPDDRSAFIWQGFRHEWLRTVAGFAVPHRISKLDSLITGESHSGQGHLWTGTATFHFGQSTGVDGNYQKPTGRFAAIHHPELHVRRGTVPLRFTDDSDRGEHPQARTSLRETIRIAGAAGDGEVRVLLLSGLRLDSACDDAKQPPDEPCNSSGMWPFRMHFGLGDCAVDGDGGDDLVCPVTVDIFRAWTPNLGGIPGFEEKPFNHRLDFSLDLSWTLLAGTAETLAVTPHLPFSHQGDAREKAPHSRVVSMVGVPDRPHAAMGLRGFGFDFIRSGTADRHNHLGRYIGDLDFGISLTDFNPFVGLIDYEARCGVWIPDTVVATDFACHLEPVAIQVAEGGAAAEGRTEGSLCINSSPQAPGITAWDECHDPDKGPLRDEHAVPIALP